jgi:hypothetical protein
MPVDSQTVSRIFAAGGRIVPVDNHLFTLDQVVLQPIRPLPEAQWRELNDVSGAPQSPRRWPTWPLGGIAVLAILLVLWKRGWSPGRASSLGIAGAQIASRTLRAAGREVHRWTWRALPIVNIGVGALALVLGAWAAGMQAGTFAGSMVIAFAVVVVAGAYINWRGSPASLRARLALLAVAVGCAMWSLGRFKASDETLWGFLPLAGAVFAFAPELYRLGGHAMTRHRGYASLAMWVVLTLLLYALGSRGSAGADENYFFTFGAIAATFALRSGVKAIEPILRRRFPKFAQGVYASPGSLYFLAALSVLPAIALAAIVKFQGVAEQLAVVLYFCLAIGVVREAWARRHGARRDANGKGKREEPLAPR